MKTGYLIFLTVLILYSFQVSHQSASQETALASSQTWPEENQPEEYKEEENTEEEIPRRPRGKRRRRMRKRQRAQHIEEIDRINNPENGQDRYFERSEAEDESVTSVEYPRRRPGKRRRRPYRRYQDDGNGPQKPLRRRRKGGRKKIRPEIQEEAIPTETPQEYMINEEHIEMETTTPFPRVNENLAEEKITTTEANVKVYQSINQIKINDVQDTKLITNAVKTDKEDLNADKNINYRNKIFDRKKLFSNSRRMLPVTSAVIRRLSPAGKINLSDNPSEQLKIEHIDNLKVNSETTTEKSKIITKPNFLPEHYVYPTEIIKPEKLIEEMRKAAKNKVDNDNTENETVEGEEPNYPKILPKPLLNKNKEQEMTTLPNPQNHEINQTEKPLVSLEPVQNKSMEEEFEKMMEDLDLKSLNITNFNDYIIDLLKTKSGKEYLSKILESRNMTLAQLVEHRERGSSQFHLFEIFPQKKSEETSTEISTSTIITTTTKSTSTTTEKEMPNILFPSDEVMESFPKFLAGKIEKHEKKSDIEVFVESTSVGTRESREPRLFESMPEFTTSITSKKEGKPTWRIIPNPKFRPVSVRGNYEEIPVSNILNKPVENNINDIYIVDDTDAEIHKKYGLLTTDDSKRDGFGSFKKIPVGIKSAIIISGIILAIATFGFLSLLISCRVRQKRSLLRAKQDLMCEHLQNEDFMASQQSLSPVLSKHQQAYSSHEAHSNPNNRHYYLWRTLRRTFRYD